MTQPYDADPWRQYREHRADAYPPGQEWPGDRQRQGDGQWHGGYQWQAGGQPYGDPRWQDQWFGDHQPYGGDHRQADDRWYGDDRWRRDGQWRGDDQWRGDGRWQREAPAQAPSRRPDASRWNWLLLVAIVVPLLTSVYNRMEPRWLGLPFFYWCQLAFAALSTAVMTTVYLATKGRNHG